MKPRTAPPILVLFATGLLALAGCGGGSSSTSMGASTASTAKANATATPKKSATGGGSKPAGGEGSAHKAAKPTASTDPEPLPNQGTSAVAPGVPIAKGGDNSIQTYGVEGESAERIAATRLLGSYLAAQAAGEWEAACAELSAMIRRKLALLAKSVPAAGKGCAGTMAAVVGRRPQAERKRAARVHVKSFRVEGDRAFLIYREEAGKAFNMPLRREGRWRIAALSGVELVL